MSPTIVTLAGSTRRASLHKELARGAAHEAGRMGAVGRFLDLADFPLPLYDWDLEQAEGVPRAAVDLHAALATADVLFIASPEYNGGYTAVLKNAIDWVTRVEKAVFARPTVLASTSSGRGGGAKGLALLRTNLEHMAVPVVGEFSIPGGGVGVGDHPLVRAKIRSALEDALASVEPLHATA